MTTVLPDFDRLISQGKISILEARKAPGEELYVLNTSDVNGRHQKGELKLKVSVEGRRVRVNVPDTWIPWELSRYTSKKVWLNDPDFVKLVDRKILTIIKDDFAREILDLEEADTEKDRLHAREQELEFGFNQTLESNEAMLESQEERDKVKEMDDKLKERQQPVQAKSNEGYRPGIKLLTVLQNKTLDENSKLNALMNMRSDLKLADMDFIMTKLSSRESKIKEWAVGMKSHMSR